jgi:hypothetical protein
MSCIPPCNYPPNEEEFQLLVRDLELVFKKFKAEAPRYGGGTIKSNTPHYFADVDSEGNFKKIYHSRDGRTKEFLFLTIKILVLAPPEPPRA